MKARLAGMLIGIALFATADQARADVLAPEGCHFAVQVKYMGTFDRGRTWYSYWETYAEPHRSLDEAEEVYDALVSANKVDKLDELLDHTNSARKFLADVRLVLICESGSVLKADKIYVISTTE